MAPPRPWDRLAVALISVAGLWPFAPALLAGQIPGQREVPMDGGNGLYIYALVGEVLAGRTSAVHTDAMWFPVGRSLLLSVQNIVDALAAQPLLWALGPQLGIAAFAAVCLVLNGLAGGWLGERIGGRGWAGPVAALVVAMSPYVWAEEQTGRITQTILAPMLLAVGWAWTAAVDGKGGVRSGAWLGIAGLGYWFYGIFGAGVVGLVFLGGLAEPGSAPRRQRLGALVSAAAVSVLLAAPFAIFTALSWADMPGVGADNPPVPNATRLAGGFFWIPHSRIVAYIPQMLYGVALVACGPRPRGRAVGLAVATLLLCLTAMGDKVRIAGELIPTPLWFLHQLPGFDRFWWPNRALAGATVALAAGAALAASRPGLSRFLAVFGVLVSVAQGAGVPGVLTGWRVPARPPWADLARPGAVLFVPMLDPDVGKARFAQWATHRRPFVNGMAMWDSMLCPPEWTAWAESQPLVAAILAAERARPNGRRKPNPAGERMATDLPPVVLPDVPATAVQDLADQGVSLIAAERPKVPRHADALLVSLLGEPTCGEGGWECWWTLPPATPGR